MNIENIDVFVKVVQTGSFTQAAKALNMPLTTVSGKVANLEKRLGVTLIHRTTRKLHVTEAGEAYYRRCLRALEEMEQAEAELHSQQQQPSGTLRMTATTDVANVLLPSIISTYLKKYPNMKIELIATNRIVDLVSENVDLAMRIGTLKDSSMLARKFLETRAHLWASPQYLKKSQTPRHPRDLSKHQCVAFSTDHPDLIRLQKNTEESTFPFPQRITVDSMEAMKALVLRGEGIGGIPQFLCEEEVKQGKLIKVLPQWIWASFRLSFVYPAQRFVSPKVQSFIEVALAEHLDA